MGSQNSGVDSGTFPGQSRRTLHNGLLPFTDLDSVGVVACQFHWAVRDGQRVVEVSLDLVRGLDVMASVPFREGDLQLDSLEGDAVVSPDDTVVLSSQKFIEVGSDPHDIGQPLFERRSVKLVVVGGQLGLLQVPVGLFYAGDAVKSQLLGEPILMRPGRPLGAPPGLGRVCVNHPDVQLGYRAAEPGKVVLVYLPTRFMGVPVVVSPVGTAGVDQTFCPDDLPDAPETAPGTFLVGEDFGLACKSGVTRSLATVQSPSQRAMMLRCISEVPEYSVLPIASRNARSTSNSTMNP